MANHSAGRRHGSTCAHPKYSAGQALLLCLVLLVAFTITMHTQVWAAISAKDDEGSLVTLSQPARRIISLAPHATELIFAAGGGERLVGAVSYSDYPEAAKAVKRVGDNQQIDIEQIIALKPDLIVVWRYGSYQKQVDQLQRMGIPLFYSQSHRLSDIADSVDRLGLLMGTESYAGSQSAQLRQQLADLNRFRSRPTVKVFYQVWDKPLYTLNGHHIVNDAIAQCGGKNIFAQLATAAPMVTLEAVLHQNPELIITTESDNPVAAQQWKAYPILDAVRYDNLMTIDGNLMNRSGPRMIAGTALLCERIEQARQHRSSVQRRDTP